MKNNPGRDSRGRGCSLRPNAEVVRMDGATRVTDALAPIKVDRLAKKLAAMARRLDKVLVASAKRPTSKDESDALSIIFALFLRKSDLQIPTQPWDRTIVDHPAAVEIIDDAVELLDNSDLEAVSLRLRDKYQTDNPATYFHEMLLAHGDEHLRRRKGVYYTPQPVVSYLVRSVDTILRQQFGRSDGLAGAAPHEAPELRIVDPACGSGAFLSGVMRHARSALCKKNEPEGCAGYLRDRLPSDLLGFELLETSCRSARLLLGGEFNELDDRLIPQVHHINPLQQHRRAHRLLFPDNSPNPLLVVIGNPPYANFGRQNRGSWIRELLRDYKQGLDEKKLNLDDDFIKFIRCSQHWIDLAGSGVLAFITNNTYLAGLTHRRMRRSLAQSFNDIYLLDLHGSGAKKERAPDGSADENIFDIRPGVAIGVMVKRPSAQGPSRVRHAELWGTRRQKLAALNDADVSTTRFKELTPQGRLFSFLPRSATHHLEYDGYPRVVDIFRQYISGVQTKNDALWVDMSKQKLAQRVRQHLASLSDNHVANRSDQKAENIKFHRDCLRPYLVAPFDLRWVYYDPRLLGRARVSVMRHMFPGNRALVFMRQSSGVAPYDHFLAVDTLCSDRAFYSDHGAPFLAPLYLLNEDRTVQPNLYPAFAEEFARRVELRYVADGSGNLRSAFGPQDVFDYLYAMFHSPAYRLRYAEELRTDFARLPLPGSADFFRSLCLLGRRLIELHLLQSGSVKASQLTVLGDGDCGDGDIVVERGFPKHDALSQRLLLNHRQSIDNIERQVWEFTIGGYKVLPRWLKQRRGRPLGGGELEHLTSIIQVARKTDGLMKKIDRTIGVWPIR